MHWVERSSILASGAYTHKSAGGPTITLVRGQKTPTGTYIKAASIKEVLGIPWE